MTINTDLLDLVLDVIEHEEKRPEGVGWDQREWVRSVLDEDRNMCGTALCFAGWAAYLNGYTEPVVEQFGVDRARFVEVDALRNPATGETLRWNEISSFARERLGLNYREADALFFGGNDLSDLHIIVTVLKGDGLRDYAWAATIQADPSKTSDPSEI